MGVETVVSPKLTERQEKALYLRLTRHVDRSTDEGADECIRVLKQIIAARSA